MKLTPRQREALAELLAIGEAIKQGPYFVIGSRQFAVEVRVFERLEKLKCVTIDRVGHSVFAVPTERGRRALA